MKNRRTSKLFMSAVVIVTFIEPHVTPLGEIGKKIKAFRRQERENVVSREAWRQNTLQAYTL